jgi:hypothetical protein
MINVRLLQFSTLLAVVLFPIPRLRAADSDFPKWWPQFQAAVAKGDAKTIAQGADFPIQWELGSLHQLMSAAELAQHFDKYFPTDLKKAVATKKPDAGELGITWKMRGNEYSLYFKAVSSGFALYYLSQGPP